MLSLGIVIYVLINNREVFSRFALFEPHTVTLAIILSCLCILVNASQTWLALNLMVSVPVSWETWVVHFFISRLMNNALSMAGTLYRAIQLKVAHGIDFPEFIAASLAVTWLNLISFSVSLLIASFIVSFADFSGHDLVRTMSLTILLGCFIPLFLPWRSLDRIVGQVRLLKKAAIHSRRIFILIRSISQHAAKIAGIVLLGVFFLMVNTLLVHSIGSVLINGFQVTHAAIFVLTMKVAGIISITPGNLGIRELWFGVVASLLAFNVQEGLVLSLSHRAIVSVPILVFGGYFAIRELCLKNRNG